MKKAYSSLGALSAAVASLLGCGLLLTAAPAPMAIAAPAPVVFKVVPAKSNFVVHSEVGGLANEDRKVNTQDFAGSVSLDKKTKQPLSLQMTIKANSFRSADNLSDRDKKMINDKTRDNILEADKYPTMTFKSTKIVGKAVNGSFNGRVLGNLTLHGVTKSIAVPITGKLTGKTISAKGEFRINQSDYNIKLLSLLGGALKVKDPLHIVFDIVATQS